MNKSPNSFHHKRLAYQSPPHFDHECYFVKIINVTLKTTSMILFFEVCLLPNSKFVLQFNCFLSETIMFILECFKRFCQLTFLPKQLVQQTSIRVLKPKFQYLSCLMLSRPTSFKFESKDVFKYRTSKRDGAKEREREHYCYHFHE